MVGISIAYEFKSPVCHKVCYRFAGLWGGNGRGISVLVNFSLLLKSYRFETLGLVFVGNAVLLNKNH
jgi:hypothetical protein